MAEWKCPICDYSASGSDEDVQKLKEQHFEQTKDDLKHRAVSDVKEGAEDIKEKAEETGEDIKEKIKM